MILGVSGHRSIHENVPGELIKFARHILVELAPDRVITGMALGWDMAVGDACLALCIPFEAAVPFPEQADFWPPDQRLRWRRLIHAAESIHTIRQHYAVGAFFERNEFIVDHCDEMAIMLEPTTQKGGTLHASLYAGEKERKTHLLWEQWKSFQGKSG